MEYIRGLQAHIEAQEERAVENDRLINEIQNREAALVDGIVRLAQLANIPINGGPEPRNSRQEARRNQTEVFKIKKV